MIYFDHNATTPVSHEVFEAMRPYFCDEWGNPSSTYRFGSKHKQTMQTAREQVAARPLAVFSFHGSAVTSSLLSAADRAA
jgi:cysteine sulfinate desulfinase/cysteine desulfurase-like protein